MHLIEDTSLELEIINWFINNSTVYANIQILEKLKIL